MPKTNVERKEYMKRWFKEHPEYLKKWFKKHPEYLKKWFKKHPEYMKEWLKEHPTYTGEYHSKVRGLGFVTLNSPFENAVAHHVDKEVVMYVPKELHDSVSHSIRTGRNMEKINAAAFKWLKENEPTLEKR